MTPEATPEELAAVREHFETDPTIAVVEFVDRAQSFERMQKLFTRQPELIRDLTVEQTPTLFRCTFVDSNTSLARIVGLGEGLPGVYKATVEPPPRVGPQFRFGWMERAAKRKMRKEGFD
jgi:hypothetical protein